MPAEIFISPHIPKIRKWDPIVNGMQDKPPVDNVDFRHMIPGGLTRLLKRQGEPNVRAMYNLLGQAGRKVRQEEKEKLLARQEEQRNRQAFRLLPGQENKQKLRRPHVHIAVPWAYLPRQPTGMKRTLTSGAGRTSPTGTQGGSSLTPTATILSCRWHPTTMTR
jgi:hypothetical protein